jgi:hypothetical protein
MYLSFCGKKIGRRPFFFKQIGIFRKKGFPYEKVPLLMNRNSVFMPKKQQGGKILKK